MENKPKLEPKSASVEDSMESPTTARPLDFDDEELKDAPALDSSNPPPKSNRSPKPKVSFADEEEAPPPKPPRPMSPQAQAEATLIEAFPSMDAKVVKAVLMASGGKVEPAFNALLSMSDPDFQADEPAPPPQPPRPQHTLSQVDADERYARQLAAHYETAPAGYGSRMRGDPPMPRQQRTSSLKPNELYDDREHSFFDDDLPVIRDNIKKGFFETQATVNKWITDFKKKIDGDDDDDQHNPQYQRQDYGPSQSEQLRGIRKSADVMRRSADRERYDPDPRTLDDNFEALELRDDEGPQQRRSNRPLANPDLFKPTPVAPQSGPVDEVEAIYRQPSPAAPGRQPSPNAGKGGKKWQPLTSIAPNPETEDNNPFSLGDSDEEDEKTKDIRAEDTERLKKAAAETDKTADESMPKLQKAETSGSQGHLNKETEDILAGKS